jgi:hypothetical protein
VHGTAGLFVDCEPLNSWYAAALQVNVPHRKRRAEATGGNEAADLAGVVGEEASAPGSIQLRHVVDHLGERSGPVPDGIGLHAQRHRLR